MITNNAAIAPIDTEEITWTLKKFNELTAADLYRILQLRNEVFVVEQNCAYQDADDKDFHALHFCGWHGEKLIAYTRLIPPGISYPQASIGRVVNAPVYRQQGIGRLLMQKSIDLICQLFNSNQIKIGAQCYLTGFYQSLGFEPCSEPYLEDGIPHIEMIFSK